MIGLLGRWNTIERQKRIENVFAWKTRAKWRKKMSKLYQMVNVNENFLRGKNLINFFKSTLQFQSD